MKTFNGLLLLSFRNILNPEDETKGIFMTAAAIYGELKTKYGASLEAKSLLSFGRSLKNMDGMKRKRTMKGTEYLAIKRE